MGLRNYPYPPLKLVKPAYAEELLLSSAGDHVELSHSLTYFLSFFLSFFLSLYPSLSLSLSHSLSHIHTYFLSLSARKGAAILTAKKERRERGRRWHGGNLRKERGAYVHTKREWGVIGVQIRRGERGVDCPPLLSPSSEARTHTHSLSWAGCFVVLEKTNKSLYKPYRLIDCTFSSPDHLQSKLEKFGFKKP